MMDQIAHIQARLSALRAEIGHPKAFVNLTIEARELYVYCAPKGLVSEPTIIVRGATPDACIDNAIAKFREMHDRLKAESLRKLATRIIELTHEHGAVTLAQLRQDCPYADALVDEATALANTMAARGPFTVIRDETLSNHEVAA